jgi:hypothetical protein
MRLKLSEILEKPDAVEELICKRLHQTGEKRSLTEEETKAFMVLIMAETEVINSIIQGLSESTIVPKALELRQSAVFKNHLIDARTIAAITLITEGNIGKSIVYLYYLQWWLKENNVEAPWFDFQTDFCQKIFPFGVFTNEAISKVWDETKVVDDLRKASEGPSDGWCGDNLIDYLVCTKSLIKS